MRGRRAGSRVPEGLSPALLGREARGGGKAAGPLPGVPTRGWLSLEAARGASFPQLGLVKGTNG